MIDVKDATKAAIRYFSDLYGSKYSNLALEEVELSNDEQYWLITLGYDVNELAQFFGPSKANRNYKIFKINARTGDIVSMKMREISHGSNS